MQVCGKAIFESTHGKLINMKDHMKDLCKQAGKKLTALARIARFLDENKRKLLMNSFVISQFHYCPVVWMFCQRQSNHMINRIHERTLRIAYNDYTSSFDNILIKDHSITIHQRNIQALAVEIYKTQNGLNPIFMKNIFSPSQHGYNTRNQIFPYQTL